MATRVTSLVFAALSLSAALSAHGGLYRGPGPMPMMPGVPGPPSSGVPTGPSNPGATPTTGDRGVSPEPSSWQTWWEFNKEPFLHPRRITAITTPVTGSDDFYLGTRRTDQRVDLLAPTRIDLEETIVPALAKLLGAERNRDIQSACLVALGKVGRDGPEVELEKALATLISRDDQEVRETAVLSLGIAGRAKALPMLCSLVRDDAEGRRLCDRSEVGDRTRAFAAYGLGMLAWRSDDAALKQQVHDLLWSVLQDDEVKDRDLLTAAVNGLGLLRADPSRSAHKRLAWQSVEELLEWYQRDLGRGDELLQAQAPIAIGRLLGRGSSPLHQRCKQKFAATLDATRRRSNPILQSSAIGLGMLAVPQEQFAEDAAVAQTLRRYYAEGHDRQARYFSLISLGRIGGEANRGWLLGGLSRANATELPWLAIALGVVGDTARRAGTVDKELAQVLLEELDAARTDDLRSALAVAVGLSGHEPAVPALLKLLRDHEGEERQAGYCCVGLALLGDSSAESTIAAVLERSLRRPFLLQQASLALGRLGDRKATEQLLSMMRDNDSVAVLAALAVAIGRIGDRRSIDPLVDMTRDQELTKLARAFVAAALGGIGDKDPMPWNVPLCVDCNFASPVDTLTNGANGVLDIL